MGMMKAPATEYIEADASLLSFALLEAEANGVSRSHSGGNNVCIC